MSLTLTDLMRESLTDPRAATRRLLGLGLPSHTLWQALAAIIVLTVLLEQAMFWLGGGGAALPDPETLSLQDQQILALTRGYAENPLGMAVIQGGLAVLAVYAIYFVGRMFGGQGGFTGALAVVAWFQTVLLALQVLQAVTGLILPPLAGIVALATIVLFFYLLTMFVAELHGFQSPGIVFAMIIATMIAMAFTITFLLTLFGITFLPELPNA